MGQILDVALGSCNIPDKFIYSEGLSIVAVHPVTIEHHLRRGRPCKVINEVYLREAIHPSRSIPRTKLTKALGVHRSTLKKGIDELGVHSKYSTIADADLDLLVKEYKVKKPNVGFRYVRGYLHSLGIQIQK